MYNPKIGFYYVYIQVIFLDRIIKSYRIAYGMESAAELLRKSKEIYGDRFVTGKIISWRPSV